MKEKYRAFYTSKRFWANSIPNFDNNNLDFMIKMGEIVHDYTYASNKINLKVCRDGMFMFRNANLDCKIPQDLTEDRMDKILNIHSNYLDYLNCIYIVFVSSVLRSMKISYFELFNITINDSFGIVFENEKFLSSGIPKNIGKDYILDRSSVSRHYDLTLIEKDYRLIVSNETFSLFNDDLEKIIIDCDKVKIISNLLKSIDEYKIGNFSVSLILSWFIIETYLNRFWNDYLKKSNKEIGEKKRINKERMDTLTGRDYTASIISNILELNNILSYDDFEIINEIRKERNKIVHSQITKIDWHLCIKAFNLIKKIFNDEVGTNLEIDTSLQTEFL